ncbi:MAG TPA: dihydrodipicolinate synthase family protein [Candidatus Sulfotelmatobacter sp.]|nr:dihydrodipicolinate synthase family protein [Candidatus Sulfotelmatobacter sp.]
MLKLNGITPVMATTFREDESIDDNALRKQIDFAIEAGAAAVCGPGFAGEFYKMSDPERYHWVEVLVEHTRKRVPAIAATSSGSTYSTIEFSRFAEKIGADCLMVTAPKTAPLPGTEIIKHYSKLCDSVSIPVMLQDADFTGAGLPAKVFVELARRHPNFRFAKLENLLPGEKCKEVVEQSNGQVQIIYGLGGIAMMDGLAHGASAMMPGAACLEIYVRVYELYQQGRKKEAKELFEKLVPYLSFALQNIELALRIEKRVMEKRGVLPNSRLRQPTLTLGSIYEQQLESLVDDVIALSEECKRQIVSA